MYIQEILKLITNLLCNILTGIVNIFIKRDKSIMLMGAWYGRRFGGNCRFLFQYLSENKEKYGLKRVIWVTRSKEICDELKELGYEVYMMHSAKSYYYHFKAGIHAVSTNTSSSVATHKKVEGDIMGQFSLGAVHIYLNHGITSIKANRITDYNKLKGMERFIVGTYMAVHKNYFFRNFVLCSGGWDRVIYLSPGKESSKRDLERHMSSEHLMFWETGFPELCKCIKYLKREQEVVDIIKCSKKTILYLPTYRTSDDTGYSHPLNDTRVCNYLKENGFFWIDKLHPGAKDNMNAEYYDPKISLKLSTDFDINVILREADVVITDYSSICHTAAYFDRPLLYYWPDHDKYIEKDKGVIKEFENDIVGYVAYNPKELIEAMNKCIDSDYMKQWSDKYTDIKNVFFDGRVAKYDEIAKSLFDYIQKNWW